LLGEWRSSRARWSGALATGAASRAPSGLTAKACGGVSPLLSGEGPANRWYGCPRRCVPARSQAMTLLLPEE